MLDHYEYLGIQLFAMYQDNDDETILSLQDMIVSIINAAGPRHEELINKIVSITKQGAALKIVWISIPEQREGQLVQKIWESMNSDSGYYPMEHFLFRSGGHYPRFDLD